MSRLYLNLSWLEEGSEGSWMEQEGESASRRKKGRRQGSAGRSKSIPCWDPNSNI